MVNLEKHEVKKYVRDFMITYFPAHQSRVTKRLLMETFIHIGGFEKCLMWLGEQPLNITDVRSTLLNEGKEFILKQLDLIDNDV